MGPHPGCLFQGCWGPFPGCFLYRSLGPLPGSWLKKKQATVTSASPTNYQMEGTHQNQFRCCLPTSSPLKKGEEPLLPAVANSHSKGGAPPCDFPEFFKSNKEAHNEEREHPHFEEGTHCPNCNKIQGNQTPRIKLTRVRKETSNNSLSDLRKFQPATRTPPFLFSLTASLSFAVAARPW